MQNPFFSLSLPLMSDAELRQSTGMPGGSTPLPNQGKAGETGRNSGFSGRLQQAISAATEEPPARPGGDSGLPANGNLLPELPVEVATPQLGEVEDSPVFREEDEPALTGGDVLLAQDADAPPAALMPGLLMQFSSGEQSSFPVQELPVPFSGSSPGREQLPRPVVTTAAAEDNIPARQSFPVTNNSNSFTSELRLQNTLHLPATDASRPVAIKADGAAGLSLPVLPATNRNGIAPTLAPGAVPELPKTAAPLPVAIKADGLVESPLPVSPTIQRNDVASASADQRVADSLKTVTPQPTTTRMEGMTKEVSGAGSPAVPAENSGTVAASASVRQNPFAMENILRAQAATTKPAGMSAAALAGVAAENHDIVASEQPRQPLAGLQNLKNQQPLAPKTERQAGIARERMISPAAFQNLMEAHRQPLQAMPAGGASFSIEQMAAARSETYTPPPPVQASLNLAGNSSAPIPVSTAASFPAAVPQNISVPVGHAAWEQSMARQVLQAGQNQLQTLEIRLNPANLGALNVHISLEADTASIVFSSHHAVVREAVEGAIPRLREMFNSSGISLGDVNVANQSAAEQQGRQPSRQYHAGQVTGTGAARQSEPASDGIRETPSKSSEQLLDYYI